MGVTQTSAHLQPACLPACCWPRAHLPQPIPSDPNSFQPKHLSVHTSGPLPRLLPSLCCLASLFSHLCTVRLKEEAWESLARELLGHLSSPLSPQTLRTHPVPSHSLLLSLRSGSLLPLFCCFYPLPLLPVPFVTLMLALLLC